MLLTGPVYIIRVSTRRCQLVDNVQQKEQCVRCRSVNARESLLGAPRPTLMRARLCFVISSARAENNDPAAGRRTSVNTGTHTHTQQRIKHGLIHHFISFSLSHVCLLVSAHRVVKINYNKRRGFWPGGVRAAASRSSKGREFRTAFSFVTRSREEKSPGALFLTRLTPGVVCIFLEGACAGSKCEKRAWFAFKGEFSFHAQLVKLGYIECTKGCVFLPPPLYGLSRRYVLLYCVHKEFYLCVGRYAVVVAGQQNVDLCV